MLCPSSCAADSTPLLFYLPYLPHGFNFHPTDATFACHPRREKQATSEETQTRQSVHACSRARLVLPKLAVKPPKYPPTPPVSPLFWNKYQPKPRAPPGLLQPAISPRFLARLPGNGPPDALTYAGANDSLPPHCCPGGVPNIAPPFPHPLSVAVRASGVTSVRLIGCCLHQLDEQKRR